ncbi:DUF2339 domain-containing protein, partial [Trinickia caryophylli]
PQPQPAAAAAPDTIYTRVTPPAGDLSAPVPSPEPPSAPQQLQQPQQPPAPSLPERAFAVARDWLLGGNTVVRVGIVVLFFGIAFLLKYAADNDMLPIEYRLAGVALAAVALLVIGWRIGAARGAYGLVLEGGGVGVLYLTVFAATRLYGLLPVAAAMPLLVAVCTLSAFLAVRQDAPALAFLGTAGGFLAPVLISTGGGSHVMLFGYYALLDAGIFAIAWFKAWRALNLLGFVFTYSIGTVWGVTAYRPELLASTEPFVILFFAIYTGIALLYAFRRELAVRHYVDGTLVFGTPIVTIGLQAALLSRIPFGLAWSAVALAAIYLAIGAWLARRRARFDLLFQSTIALAVIFATIAIPLAFSGPTTSAAWAIEGAAVVWLGTRQRRHVQLAFGVLMQLAAAAAYLASVPIVAAANGLPVLNGPYIATLLIALAGIFTGWWLHGRDETKAWHAWLEHVGLASAFWGLLWWLGGGANEIAFYARHHDLSHFSRFLLDAFVLFALVTAWLAHLACRVLGWPLAERAALALAPALAMLALAGIGSSLAPLSGIGALAWPFAVVLGYLLLWRQERTVSTRILGPLHTVLFATLCLLLAHEGYWRMRAYVPEGAWSFSAWAYGFGLLLLAVSSVGARLRWPIGRFARAYQLWGCGPLAFLLWLWALASLASDGSAAPLWWLPVLNPLDVAELLMFVAILAWLRRVRALGVAVPSRPAAAVMLATLFLWLNALLLRTLHHWTGVEYRLSAMMESTLAQASISVLWTVCALAVTVWATRRRERTIWFVGAGLLVLTVIKLFLFDLSYVQGLERIVSFIGIGIMLLLIGYFSPLPPKKIERDRNEGPAS